MYLSIYLKKNDKTNKQKKTKQTKTREKKKKKEGRKKWMSRIRTQHLQLVATLPNHYTTKADYIILAKSFLFNAFPRKIHRQKPLQIIELHKTVLLTVKKNSNKNRTHFMAMNEWKKIHCMLYKAIHLACKVQNICFLISIKAVTLKLMVKKNYIHFWLIQVLKNSTWHDIFSLSDHFPASWNLYTVYPPWFCGVKEEIPIFSSIQSQS